jgi:hypothetical protein
MVARVGGVALTLVVGVVLAGCTKNYDQGAGGGVTVSGRVTLDGKPVSKGSVSLKPTDGTHYLDGPGGSGAIENGPYKIVGVFPGKYFVVLYLGMLGVEQPKEPYDIPDTKNYTIDLDLKMKPHR